MSQEHDKSTPNEVTVSDGIHPEPTPFEPGYQPGTVPQISVPDLPEDAQGLSAEALAQVPTLTELVDVSLDTDPAPPQLVQPEADLTVAQEVGETAALEPEPNIQDAPVQADTWGQELQVRMGKLTDEIHTLNARLDRLEELNNTKV